MTEDLKVRYQRFCKMHNEIYHTSALLKKVIRAQLLLTILFMIFLNNGPTFAVLNVACATLWLLSEMIHTYYFRANYEPLKGLIDQTFRDVLDSDDEFRLTPIGKWWFKTSLEYLGYISAAYIISLI